MNDYTNDYFRDVYWYFEDAPEPDDKYPADENNKVFDNDSIPTNDN